MTSNRITDKNHFENIQNHNKNLRLLFTTIQLWTVNYLFITNCQLVFRLSTAICMFLPLVWWLRIPYSGVVATSGLGCLWPIEVTWLPSRNKLCSTDKQILTRPFNPPCICFLQSLLKKGVSWGGHIFLKHRQVVVSDRAQIFITRLCAFHRWWKTCRY